MKAKLIKYPFDKKKYRWNTYEQGREFEYTWNRYKTTPFNHISPYLFGTNAPRSISYDDRTYEKERIGAYDFQANTHPTVGYTTSNYQYFGDYELAFKEVEFLDKKVNIQGYCKNYYPNGYNDGDIEVTRKNNLYLKVLEQRQFSVKFRANALVYGYDPNNPNHGTATQYLYDYFSYNYNGELITPTQMEFIEDRHTAAYHPFILVDVYLPYFVNIIVPTTETDGTLVDTNNEVWTEEEVCANLFNNNYKYGFYGCEGTVKGYTPSYISQESMYAHGYWAKPVYDTKIQISPTMSIYGYEGTDYPKEGDCVRNMICSENLNFGWSYAHYAMAAGFDNFIVEEHYTTTEPTIGVSSFRTTFRNNPRYYGKPSNLLSQEELVKTLTKKPNATVKIFTASGRREA